MEKEVSGKLQLEGLTYPCPLLTDFTLDDNLRAKGLMHGKHYSRRPPTADLGALGVIPLEILQNILPTLDVQSLMAFRRVNRMAMEVVESTPQYKAVAKHAPSALRGIICVEAGKNMSLETIHEKLCTAECEECGDFGGYLYILTCKRVCFLCLSQNIRFLPLLRSQAIRKFGLKRHMLRSLPCMTSIPGTYSPLELNRRERQHLVDYESAYLAGIAHHGSIAAMEQCAARIAAREEQRFQKKFSNLPLDRSQSFLDQLLSLIPAPRRDFNDLLEGNPLRFMAIVHMPCLVKGTRELEWGFHCIGCEDLDHSRPLHFRRKFTLATFTEHLEQHGNIRNRKHYLEY
jgi:hypothetical protein